MRGALAAGQTRDHQPRSRLPQQTHRRDRLIRLAAEPPTWALGCADDVWWSRLAHPTPHRGEAAAAVTRLQDLTRAKRDPEPHALACSGVLVRRLRSPAEPMWRRLVAGRPVSAVTTAFLAWGCDRVAGPGITAWLRIWDHAAWHTSQAVRAWIHTHHPQVNTCPRGVRIVASWLPVKSPWLNPIEPKWVHGKRAVSEPDRLLSAAAWEARVCTYDACPAEAHVLMPQKVA